MNYVSRKAFKPVLSVLLAIALVLGLCPGFGAAFARADEGSQTPPSAPEGAPVVAADGTTTNRDGSVGDPIDAIDVYRFYNPYTGEHLFTQQPAEILSLLAAGWHDETIAWLAPEVSAMPMWRLYNPYTGEHLYTMDENEYTTLSSIGWNGESIFAYSASPEGSVPVYRLYNPYVVGVGAHHYTTDPNEKASLITLGWKADESTTGGAVCYGLVSDPIDDHDIDWNDDVVWLESSDWTPLTPAEPANSDDQQAAADSETATAADHPTLGGPGSPLQIFVPESEKDKLAEGKVLAGEPGSAVSTGTAIVIEIIEPIEGGYIVSGHSPEIGELVDYMDVSGTSDNVEGATVAYAKGVEADPDVATEPGELALTIDPEELGIADALTIEGENPGQVPDPALEYKKEIEEGINLVIRPNIKYDFQYSWFSIRKAMLSVVLDTSFEFANISSSKEFDQEIATYSFPVPWTFNTVWVTTSFSLVASATGSITLAVTSHVEEGFVYENGKVSWISDTPYPALEAKFRGSLRGGVVPDVLLTILGINTVYLGVEGGIGLDGEIKANTNGEVMCDVTGYPYMKLLLNRKWNTVGGLISAFGLPTDFEVLNKNNAPNWNWHIEANAYS